eukprot:scaffold87210_cov35-Tisochrysis_lutea.AAC.4
MVMSALPDASAPSLVGHQKHERQLANMPVASPPPPPPSMLVVQAITPLVVKEDRWARARVYPTTTTKDIRVLE